MFRQSLKLLLTSLEYLLTGIYVTDGFQKGATSVLKSVLRYLLDKET